MPTAAQIEAFLAELQRDAARATTRNHLADVLWALHRFAGRTPMIAGTVVPPEQWEPYAPRFAELRAELEQRVAKIDAPEAKAILRLHYPAELIELDTNAAVTDREVLARCAGARERAHLEVTLAAPGIAQLIWAGIEEGADGLVVVIEVGLTRRATDAELAAIERALGKRLAGFEPTLPVENHSLRWPRTPRQMQQN